MEPVKLKITEYQIHDHGVDNPQYFQGHGLAFTDYEDTATGCSTDSYWTAFQDALECLAQGDYDPDELDRIEAEHKADLISDGLWDKAQIDHVQEAYKEAAADNGIDPDDGPAFDKFLQDDSGDGMYYYVSVDVK